MRKLHDRIYRIGQYQYWKLGDGQHWDYGLGKKVNFTQLLTSLIYIIHNFI